jgi:vacuolar-type H+-ATPase subunit I/STV1
LDDTITFDGGLMEVTRWHYDENEGETFTNPVTIGDSMRQTYARVDKANKRIDLVVSDVTEQGGQIAQLSLTTDEIKAEVQRVEGDTTSAVSSLAVKADEISASVKSVETQLTDTVDSLNENIVTLTKEVEAKMTSDEVSLAIKQTLDDGVDKVTTSTGYTFDEEGLTVSKSNSEMTTQITEDGMTIRRNDDEMLTADHTGVKATNLHATTYLMVGGRSRFENYESDRTGCFWIGGTN